MRCHQGICAEGKDCIAVGGWVGYCGYDTVRYVYGSKLPFSSAPPDDRGLPEMHLALYNKVLVFDASTKLVYLVVWVNLEVKARPKMGYLGGLGFSVRFCG